MTFNEMKMLMVGNGIFLKQEENCSKNKENVMCNCSSMLAFKKNMQCEVENIEDLFTCQGKIVSTERVMISNLSVGNDLAACFLLFKGKINPFYSTWSFYPVLFICYLPGSR